jgi:alanyl-tRNA synthetase
MDSNEIRQRFLKFFEKRGHAIIPSAPLVPENDPSVLFNTAGMQPLAPYLLGAPHPKGKRLANAQKCVRTGDIDEIGDNTHVTFFEMLGNWSLGDYFKEESIKWSYKLLTSEEEGFGLDPRRLYVTVFEGNEDAPRDEESAAIWKKIFSDAGISGERIYFLPAMSNWWSPGDNGPCGSDTEMFYDVTGKLTNGMTKEGYLAADERQEVVEVWNNVFMEYEKKDGKVVGRLAQRNVDTGSGLERITMAIQGKNNIFDTDLFVPVMEAIETRKPSEDKRGKRIIADHIRTAVFLIADGVEPSHTDRGSVLRKLLRRAFYYFDSLEVEDQALSKILDGITSTYKDTNYNLNKKISVIKKVIGDEKTKFSVTLISGKRELEKIMKNNRKNSSNIFLAKDAFLLQSEHGYPFELTKEIVMESQMVMEENFNKKFQKFMEEHQRISRAGAGQKFKGGLADVNETTVMLHTSTHLMLAGLRKYLGNHVHQAGSNITAERTRFDFIHPEKVPQEVLNRVEAYVNEAIGKGCVVSIEQMPKGEAQKRGVEGSFWEKYPDVVNVYMVKDLDGTIYSQELCGGPHVESTATIKGTFKIIKEETVSKGVRRVKAVLA